MQTYRYLLLAITAFVTFNAGAQVVTPESANAIHQSVEDLRKAANAKVEQSKLEPGALEAAAANLERARRILGTGNGRELAAGNEYLFYKQSDVHRDLADVYARMGQKELAIGNLQDIQSVAWSPGLPTLLADLPALSEYRSDPRFQSVIATSQIPNNLWNNPEIATGYKAVLSDAEKVAGLSVYWTMVRDNFVHFDGVPDLQWSKVYLQFLNRVLKTKTTEDYYRVLMQLAPLLRDGHTNIYPPEELADTFYARPPLATILIENKVLIDRVSSPTLRKLIMAGDEIVQIDGIAVHKYAEARISPFVSSSTDQDRNVRLYSYQLLMGNAKKPVRLGLRSPGGQARTVVIARSGYRDIEPRKKFEFRKLDDDTAYIALDGFEDEAPVKAFEKALPLILQSKSLIIDMRRNGGGSTSYANQILSYLTTKPIRGADSFMRGDNAYQRRNGNIIKWQPHVKNGHSVTLARKDIFTGKVAILTGPQTFSAGEDFLVAFRQLERGIIVGEATGGSTGQPVFVKLPGGGSGRFCAKRDVFPGGERFVGKGILPNLEVHPTVDSVRAGIDLPLNAARDALSAGQAPKQAE